MISQEGVDLFNIMNSNDQARANFIGEFIGKLTAVVGIPIEQLEQIIEAESRATTEVHNRDIALMALQALVRCKPMLDKEFAALEEEVKKKINESQTPS